MTLRRNLNCAAAGIAAATLTGGLAGAALWCAGLVTDDAGGASLAGLLWLVAMGSVFGAIGGTPSGVLVMCLSRAKEAPWRSLPVLLLGTTVGFVVLGLPLQLPLELFQRVSAPSWLGPAMWLIGPTIGGIVAIRFLPPPSFNRISNLPAAFVFGFLVGLVAGAFTLLFVGGQWSFGSGWFFEFPKDAATRHVIRVCWLAFYAIVGTYGLVAVIRAIAEVKRTLWTGLGAGLASGIFLAGACFSAALATT
jgi:hypothetical protein